MTDAKSKYRRLCLSDKSIPLCSMDWWLDAAVGEAGWQVVLVESGEGVIAALPYVLQRKWQFFKVIQMPRFSTGMGVWIKYPPDQKYHSRLSFELKTINQLIDQLPSCDRFFQRFHPEFQNWLPFFWKGFQQTTRYTYIIEDLSDLEQVFRNFADNIRREIRKAQKKVTVEKSDNPALMYHMNSLTFKRQGRKMIFSQTEFIQFYEALNKKDACRIMVAKDEQGKVHSAIMLMYDAHKVYYLMGGSDPELRNSGAASLLMWHAIQFAAEVSTQFDFEGSMLQPIERFFRSFGAKQTPYFAITKNKHIFKLLDAFRAKT